MQTELNYFIKHKEQTAYDKLEALGLLNEGLEQVPMDLDKLVACFDYYLTLDGKPISRAIAERRMLERLGRSLTEDIAPLLPPLASDSMMTMPLRPSIRSGRN